MQTKQFTKTLLISSLALMSTYGYADEKTVNGKDRKYPVGMIKLGSTISQEFDTTSSFNADEDNDTYYNFSISLDQYNNNKDFISVTDVEEKFSFSGAVTVPNVAGVNNLNVTAGGMVSEKGDNGYGLGVNYSYQIAEGLSFQLGFDLTDAHYDKGDPVNGTFLKDGSGLGIGLGYYGLSVSYSDHETEGASEDCTIDYKKYGVSYVVNDGLTLSAYKTEKESGAFAGDDEEINSFGIKYSMGGISLGASYMSIDNLAGNSDKDVNTYGLSLALAF